MSLEIKVPPLAESITEATVLAWHVVEGAPVQRDQKLVDIETDKVVLEVPAPRAGVLQRILKGVGNKVQSHEVLALMEEGQDSTVPLPAATVPEAPVLVMPAASKILREQGREPSVKGGSGRGGRILKEDVIQDPTSGQVEPAGVETSSSLLPGAPRQERRTPLSALRRRVAERLMASQSGTATLTTFNEVDMSAVLALRQRYKDSFEKKHGIRLGLMSFFVKAVVSALQRYPVLNARIEGTDWVTPEFIDIGVAIGSKRGLLVPILRDAQRLSMADIERQIADFSQRADAGHITLEELSGGTFSITNGGVFGSMLSTPILNPPQSAILGIHATRDRPMVVEGEIVIRPMNYLALSYDHRLIDGREAVLGLVAMKEGLEDPARWLLDL
ncbi:2-oxoglutarate dehydrogenase complex dihydrolipoyllysine-residue succinyltransferase [Ferrovum myxofaciens]|uniref:Dihydrolipoyllysine-residue succinyltransferase component of 2-oxoglutarate dehydrogenase complex n=1 Tax=Ferrovum myxofaciens TaxID=416213 RepID=A0A9E6MXF2_9PROT|nr:2-oxoglutarate dehydrogenase complex dihydrolipoyllysine-residue succinyltransferase [Ferrovum myxofaciens]MBU6993870.1 2-oxoglutarate dehydrogenase complex dihydrolipoyllysine-residue succinyltransferase [Ferrovum myxofaciens]QKE37744.1 MAG: 2-oxoglutarate dehydrogenase complex dihydrolipoyllysine-residue succinyltransferase [Ferrovum myxofaciens]QWY75412.1 MAG: 2-oxoglutarate dehydrogenase complex dihydrolipoyllysine-residue succinyltransferase [Ferrovum myxofaciens]QWY78152.1 MAG: 2-oxogl